LPGAFPIVDTHPDETATTDLRLLTPWPELVDFARDMTKDIDSLDAYEHGHLPYVVILMHYLEQWKQAHEGKYPSTYKEKTEFRRIVQGAARTDNPEGGEENFDEAAAAVLKTVVPPSLPSGLREVFDYTPSEPVGFKRLVNTRKSYWLALTDTLQIEERSSFWIVADAIKAFHAKHKTLPLRGNVPDMKAKSSVYIQLQNIYKTKARQDAAEVLETAQSIAPGRQFDPAEVELFCKNAPFIKLINATKGGDSASASSVDLLREVTGKFPQLDPRNRRPGFQGGGHGDEEKAGGLTMPFCHSPGTGKRRECRDDPVASIAAAHLPGPASNLARGLGYIRRDSLLHRGDHPRDQGPRKDSQRCAGGGTCRGRRAAQHCRPDRWHGGSGDDQDHHQAVYPD
jgi:hypothetical protein